MIDGFAAVLPVLCGDSCVRQFAGRLSLLKDPSGRVVGAMAIYWQITPDMRGLPILGA
jgi:hypothetical protein